jgi:hypothetical protein
MAEEITVKTRKAIDTLWKECLAHARGWGLKGKDDNIFEGSNITLINKNEVVVLAINPENKKEIAIHEFTRVTNTVLGSRIAGLLHDHQVERSYKQWVK